MKTDCNSGLRGNGSNLSDLDIQLESFFKKPYFVLVRSTFYPWSSTWLFSDIIAIRITKNNITGLISAFHIL